jgi:dolichol-phosphate mannosyltransferase
MALVIKGMIWFVSWITIGIIGEYVGKIYQEIQKRPQYLIKDKVNI